MRTYERTSERVSTCGQACWEVSPNNAFEMSVLLIQFHISPPNDKFKFSRFSPLWGQMDLRHWMDEWLNSVWVGCYLMWCDIWPSVWLGEWYSVCWVLATDIIYNFYDFIYFNLIVLFIFYEQSSLMRKHLSLYVRMCLCIRNEHGVNPLFVVDGS